MSKPNSLSSVFPTPAQLAVLTGGVRPNTEQSEIIETGLDKPLLVVAGAGSGKTETIASRLVYWVVKAGIRPEEILGLTFTNKATNEMRERFTKRLGTLADVMEVILGTKPQGLWGGELRAEAQKPELVEGLKQLSQSGITPQVLRQVPTVSTYDSFAATLLGEFGFMIGRDAVYRNITDGARFQIMMELVEGWSKDLRYKSEEGANIGWLVEKLLKLAGDANAHVVEWEKLKQTYEDTKNAALELVDMYERGEKKLSKEIRTGIESIIERMQFGSDAVEIIQEFGARKESLHVADFSDQTRAVVGLAKMPLVRQQMRQRYRLILLDEFQDTSIAQMDYLSSLFQDCPVTAVGDPKQAIYAWRGASEASLEIFPQKFASDGNIYRGQLATSWRNDKLILEAANRIAAEINTAKQAPSISGTAAATPADKPPEPAKDAPPSVLNELRVRDDAADGEVIGGQFLTDRDQAKAVAGFLKRWQREREEIERANHKAGKKLKLPTAAVLCRTKAIMAPIMRELDEAGIAYQESGKYSLLEDPAVLLVRAALEVVADTRNSRSLLLLLDRYRVGIDDLRQIGKQDRDSDIYRVLMSESLGGCSPEAGSRMAKLRELFRMLHDNAEYARPSTLARLTYQALGLDIETALPESGMNAQAFESFCDLIVEFERGPNPTLHSFLEWLAAAAEQESGLGDLAEEPDESRVQLITVHTAKGLEWDYVAVPSLNKGDFPNTKSTLWFDDYFTLPYPVRQDKAYLPSYGLSSGAAPSTGAEFKKFLERCKQEQEQVKLVEEANLAYVAFTRAKSHLFVSTCWFKKTNANPVPPGIFFDILSCREAHLVGTDGKGSVPSEATASPEWIEEGGLLKLVRPENINGVKVETLSGEIANLTKDDYKQLEKAKQDEVQKTISGLCESNTTILQASKIGIPNPNEVLLDIGIWPGKSWLERREKLQKSYQLVTSAQAADLSVLPESSLGWRVQKLLTLSSGTETAEKLLTRVSATEIANLARSQDSQRSRQNESENPVWQRLRPIPSQPSSEALLGTILHAWIAEQLDTPSLFDLDIAMGSLSRDEQTKLGKLKTNWRIWQENNCRECRVESVESRDVMLVPGTATHVVAQPDFVYTQKGKVHIVDWKTGRRPRLTAKNCEYWIHQLGIYRLYWLYLHPQLRPEDIECAYVFLNYDDPASQVLTLDAICEKLGRADYTQSDLREHLETASQTASKLLSQRRSATSRDEPSSAPPRPKTSK